MLPLNSDVTRACYYFDFAKVTTTIQLNQRLWRNWQTRKI